MQQKQVYCKPACSTAQMNKASCLRFLSGQRASSTSQAMFSLSKQRWKKRLEWRMRIDHVVIWDNVSFHRAALVREWFQDHPHFSVLIPSTSKLKRIPQWDLGKENKVEGIEDPAVGHLSGQVVPAGHAGHPGRRGDGQRYRPLGGHDDARSHGDSLQHTLWCSHHAGRGPQQRPAGQWCFCPVASSSPGWIPPHQ